MPALYLLLSQYAHIMLCTAGMDNSYIYRPDGQQERLLVKFVSFIPAATSHANV